MSYLKPNPRLMYTLRGALEDGFIIKAYHSADGWTVEDPLEDLLVDSSAKEIVGKSADWIAGALHGAAGVADATIYRITSPHEKGAVTLSVILECGFPAINDWTNSSEYINNIITFLIDNYDYIVSERPFADYELLMEDSNAN